MTDFFLLVFFFFSLHLFACALSQLRYFLRKFCCYGYKHFYFLFLATRIGSGRFNQQQRTQEQGQQRRKEGNTIAFSMSWTQRFISSNLFS